MIGNKIADKITSVSKKSAKELPNDETKKEEKEDAEDAYLQKKDNKMLTN